MHLVKQSLPFASRPQEAIHSKSDNSPLVGEEMIGKVIVTINKGYITATP